MNRTTPKLLLAALLLLPAPALFAASAYVQNTADSGTNSLRQAILDINAHHGASNSITWDYGSAGTLTLLSDLTPVNYDTTWDLNGYNFTIADSTNAMSVAAALTIFSDSVQSTVTINEDIGGTGSIIKTGDGFLVLTGTNSYTGGTYINGGVLSTNWDGALGAAGGLLSFDGGTLRLLNSMASARPVTLNSGGGYFDTNSYTLALSGIISGAGGLYKEGGGTLVLSGANTYLGTTTVDAGTLQLGASNSIPQASTVSVAAAGTFDLAGYTQTIASYSGAGTLALKLQPGVTNLTVTGAANVAGSALRVTYAPQIINSGDTFTPITAGTLTGTFTSITSPAAVIFTPTYSSGGLLLTASLVPFASIAANANQQAVGAALEPLRAGASTANDIGTVLAYMYTMDAAALRSALDQLSPVALLSMRGLAGNAAENTAYALRPRLAELSGGGGGGGFSSYYSAGSSGDYVTMDEARKMVKKKDAKPARQLDNGGPWGFFASATGGGGDNLTHKDGQKEGPAYTFYSGGVAAGTDYRLWDSLTVGVAGAYSQGKADVYSPSKATVKDASTRYGVYAAGGAGGLRASLYAGKAQDQFDTDRKITFYGAARTATASPSGSEKEVRADAYYQYGDLAHGGVTAPYASLDYWSLKTDPFSEKGADSLDISAQGMSAVSLRSTAGLRFAEAVDYGDMRVVTSINAGWAHQFRDQDLEMDSAFAAGGSAFAVRTGDAVRDALKAGARISTKWEGGITGYLAYDGEYSERYTSHTGSAGLSFQF
jgi:autotransporter-associated beta strand protein